jgi:hypothetical protein
VNSKLPAVLIILASLAAPAFAADSSKPGDEVVVMKPYVVEEKSLAKAGFGLQAKFRHHLIWAGVKEIVVIKVEPRSAAKKAGLEVGEKIIQIRDVKVDGLGIKALQKEFEKKSVDGKIPLVIQAKDSAQTRMVELQFGKPAEPAKPAPDQAKSPPAPGAAPADQAPPQPPAKADAKTETPESGKKP